MNLQKFGNSYKEQPNGSALRIFAYYCGGVTSHDSYSTNHKTKPSILNSPKRFSSRKGKERIHKSYVFSFFSQFFSLTKSLVLLSSTTTRPDTKILLFHKISSSSYAKVAKSVTNFNVSQVL